MPTDAHTEHVVEVVGAVAPGALPAGALHLARLLHFLAVLLRRVLFGLVVVVAGLGGPRRLDVRVVGPEGHVDAGDLLHLGHLLQVARAEPELAEPVGEGLVRALLVDGEGQQRLGADGVLVLRLLQHLRRAAEGALGGGDAVGEDDVGAALLALGGARRRCRRRGPWARPAGPWKKSYSTTVPVPVGTSRVAPQWSHLSLPLWASNFISAAHSLQVKRCALTAFSASTGAMVLPWAP